MNFDAVLDGAQAMAQAFVPFLLTSVAVLTGFFILFQALYNLFAKGADRRGGQDMSYGAIAIRLFIGGLMIRLGPTIDDLSQLAIGSPIQPINGVLAYAPLPAEAGPWLQVLEVCLLWVVMLGWAGAFRGLLLWNKAASGGGSGGSAGDLFWQGLWHLIGGALAVNLTGAIQSFVGK